MARQKPTPASNESVVAKYVEKIEAVQWFKSGDHPEIAKVFGGSKTLCEKCDRPMSQHGCLRFDPSSFACPGDWVVTNRRGKSKIVGRFEFSSWYEPAGG